MTSPARTDGLVVLARGDWLPLAAGHAAHADALTAGHRERRKTGAKHPIDDFLYDYYGVKPTVLRRWHPGPGLALGAGVGGEPAEHAAWRWYDVDEHGAASVDVAAFIADRGDSVRHLRTLLGSTASRRPLAGCFGLHEWAMVYRQDAARRRHALPLRLGRAGTDAVVEANPIRCTHFDAFRFFTPDAVGRTSLQLTRESQVDVEQPGCLHANMDLFRAAGKLGPALPGAVLLACFELAREIRTLDMQASPYDVSSLGEPAVAIETAAGKVEYASRQRAFGDRAAVLRAALINAIDDLLAR